MVLYIKKTNYIEDEIDFICKMMINIEHNQTIFNSDGVENNEIDSKKPYNRYTYKSIDYNITPSVGVLIVYIEDNINSLDFRNMLKDKFVQLDKDIKKKIPYSAYPSANAYHTLVTADINDVPLGRTTTQVTGNSYRKLLHYDFDARKCASSGSRFVWLINLSIAHYGNVLPYLQIAELTDDLPTREYLMRGVSTIIYDGINLLNVKNGLKQLNYPALTDYVSYYQVVF
jgi:hypothetical protein